MQYLQGERLVPDRVEVGLDRFRLLFRLNGVGRNQLELDVRVG